MAGHFFDCDSRTIIHDRIWSAPQQESLIACGVSPVYFSNDVLITAVVPHMVLANVSFPLKQIACGAWFFAFGHVSFQC